MTINEEPGRVAPAEAREVCSVGTEHAQGSRTAGQKQAPSETPIADLIRARAVFLQQWADAKDPDRDQQRRELEDEFFYCFEPRKHEAAARFAELNGWEISDSSFTPDSIGWDWEDRQWRFHTYSNELMQNEICFKEKRTGRCIAIVFQPYAGFGSIDALRPELNALDEKWGLCWHVSPNPLASIHLPGRAFFIVVTLPGVKINWLSDQQKQKQKQKQKQQISESEGLRITDFVAYAPAHNYFYLPTREPWPASSINSRLLGPYAVLDDAGKIKLDNEGEPTFLKASAWLDQFKSVEQTSWCPGLPVDECPEARAVS